MAAIGGPMLMIVKRKPCGRVPQHVQRYWRNGVSYLRKEAPRVDSSIEPRHDNDPHALAKDRAILWLQNDASAGEHDPLAEEDTIEGTI